MKMIIWLGFQEIHQKSHHEPKPKKQRKKTKPSALTRPPKKGKKKKQKQKKICLGLTASSINNSLEGDFLVGKFYGLASSVGCPSVNLDFLLMIYRDSGFNYNFSVRYFGLFA